MSTVIRSSEPKIKSVKVTNDAIIAHLADGRVISVPLAWSWRLSQATRKQREHYELIGEGLGVHWPDIDEDISVDGMLRGTPAKRPSRTQVQIEGHSNGRRNRRHESQPQAKTELRR